jgi:hypothetical protein
MRKMPTSIIRLASAKLHLSSSETQVTALSMGDRSKVNAAVAGWFRERAAHIERNPEIMTKTVATEAKRERR